MDVWLCGEVLLLFSDFCECINPALSSSLILFWSLPKINIKYNELLAFPILDIQCVCPLLWHFIGSNGYWQFTRGGNRDFPPINCRRFFMFKPLKRGCNYSFFLNFQVVNFQWRPFIELWKLRRHPCFVALPVYCDLTELHIRSVNIKPPTTSV